MTLRPLILTAALLAAGCGSTPFSGPSTFIPHPLPGHEVRENRHAGGFAVQSSQARSMVRLQQVMGDNLEEHGALFKLVVLNTGAEGLSFGVEDLSATRGGKALAIVDRSRLTELEKGKKASGERTGSLMQAGAVVGGLLATVATAMTGQGNLSQSQMQSASQSIGTGMAGSVEAAGKAKEGSHVASDARVELYDLVALQRGFIQPGAAAGGYFVLESKGYSGDETLVKVRLGADEHQFRFKQKMF